MDKIYPHITPELITQTASAINKGKICVFPTWCLYGLGADALNPVAVKKIFNIKRRPISNPLLILIQNKELLSRYVKSISKNAEILIENFWPGKITLIFESSDALPTELTGGTGKIGIRIPEHKIAKELLKQCNSPITATSANISGGPSCSDINTLDSRILKHTDTVLNAGRLKGGAGSTIVDTTMDKLNILREGAIKKEKILSLIH